MAEINKNVTIAEPFYSTGTAPVDAKMTPAATFDELKVAARIPVAQRYVGLTVTVLNSGTTNIPTDYWLVGGVRNSNWKIKAGNLVDTKANLLLISPSACTIGLEMVVQADETNGGKVTKYWVTAIENGTVTWEQKRYGAGVTVDGEDLESVE